MIHFELLNKQEKTLWLPKLFDLLFDNMHAVASSGLSYEQERELFLANVSPALEKAPRRIVLCFVDGRLAGYVQFYTRGDLVMIEELQIKKVYQRTMVFLVFCKYMLRMLPAELVYIEAYADKRNLPSQTLMRKLGMEEVMREESQSFVHFRGTLHRARELFRT